MPEINPAAAVASLSVMSCVTILFNLALIAVILSDRNLRSTSKYILILAVCLCDLITGTTEYPALADYFNRGGWIHSCVSLHVLHSYIPQILIPLRMSLMIGVLLDSIFRIFINTKRILTMLTACMIVCAVLSSLVSMLPITIQRNKWIKNEISIVACDVDFARLSHPGLSSVIIFPQCVAIVVLAICISVLHIRYSKDFPESHSDRPSEFPKDVVLASILMAVLHTPSRLYIVAGLHSPCRGTQCSDLKAIFDMLFLVESVRPCLMPFVWLWCRETRDRIRTLYLSCSRRVWRETTAEDTRENYEILNLDNERL